MYLFPESTCSAAHAGEKNVLEKGMDRTRKRRKYSKKSKANLRKFTDVKDVEEFLEERRIEERTG